MIIERSMQQDWLSNAYLVGDEENGKAVVIDSGGPSQPGHSSCAHSPKPWTACETSPFGAPAKT